MLLSVNHIKRFIYQQYLQQKWVAEMYTGTAQIFATTVNPLTPGVRYIYQS